MSLFHSNRAELEAVCLLRKFQAPPPPAATSKGGGFQEPAPPNPGLTLLTGIFTLTHPSNETVQNLLIVCIQ